MAERSARGARRSRGRCSSQKFIRGRRLAAELVRDAGITHEDTVVDIGAGEGALTGELAQAARHVYAVELDARLAQRLRERFSTRRAIEVVEADFVEWPLPREAFKAVANIPFDRTNAILRHLLDDPGTPLRRADLVVEWGAALKRATVWPGTLLGVRWGVFYTFSVSRRLPRRSFQPAPSVDAGVLTVERRPLPLVPEQHCEAFATFVSAGFEAADRELRTTLAPFVSARQLKRMLDELGVPRSARARDLDVHGWARLFVRSWSPPSGRRATVRSNEGPFNSVQ
ncbi:MAG: 23S ribosomal RNA methyltransferase Erm [Actinobacteria bacterium]|nr:23S ribosomal RNA methyltransferase Erm [Actinomycetota bacterium]